MREYTKEELETYVKSARKIAKQNGDCIGVSCNDCPFEDADADCRVDIRYLAAMGFLALYDKENNQEDTKDGY